LPPGREEQLFAKFSRGERESSTPGVGLGLAICHAIVQAHGGSIRAENLNSGGASFVISLPLGQPPVLPHNENVENENEMNQLNPNPNPSSEPPRRHE
ncbi:ATP-binding protein, partial [Roseateles sp. GG27B]